MAVGGKHTLEAKVDLAGGRVAWVRGPHCSKRLADAAECVFDGATSDFSVGGVEDPMAEAPGKDLEKRDWVGDAGEIGGRVEGGTKGDPFRPMGTGFAGAGRDHSSGDFLGSKAEIAEETMVGWGRKRRQG